MIDSSRLYSTLQDAFGLLGFRPGQEEIVRAVLSRIDTLAVMPTGGGKSLCYQLPSLLLPGTTLVISPLISLMKDQVDRLRALGLPAATLNSSTSANESSRTLRDLTDGRLKLLYVSPERILSKAFCDTLENTSVSLIAIDEAHCISEWGHDFRTSYRKLPQIYEVFTRRGNPRPPVIAVTATAGPEVRSDIRKLLEFRDSSETFVAGFARPNLRYGVITESQKPQRVNELAASIQGSKIIYAASRKNVDQIVHNLSAAGLTGVAYHAGLPAYQRQRAQDRFLSGHAEILVATSAFGMGIDKANVRAVMHYDIPSSIEQYYQESGRAGRDGESAMAILFYNIGDERMQQFFIRISSPTESELRQVYNALHELVQNPMGNLYEKLIVSDERTILSRIPKPGAPLSRVLEVLEENGHLTVQKLNPSTLLPRIRFTAGRHRFEEISSRSRSQELKRSIDALMRFSGSAAFESEVAIDEARLMKSFEIKPTEFQSSIRTLESLGLLRYSAPPKLQYGQAHALYLTNERIQTERLMLDIASLERRLDHQTKKLGEMIRFAGDWRCRARTLTEYFGEKVITDCGRCDVCTRKTNRQ